MGFRLNLKGVFPVPSHFLPNYSPSRLPSSSSSSVRGKEASFNSTRLSLISDEGVFLSKDPPKAYASPAALQTLENGCSDIEEKVNIDKGPQSQNCSHVMVGKSHEPIRGNRSSSCASPQTCKASRYNVLMDNLHVLEETFVDSDVLRLEREILVQLGRLGALNLFNIFLSHKPSNIFDLSDDAANSLECIMNGLVDSEKDKIIVSSRKNKQRRKRREKAVETTTISTQLPPTNTLHGRYQKPKRSSPKRMSDSRKRRSAVARNEVEMSKGVKVVANLERIRATLEEETGRIVSLSCWAEAAKLTEKVLQQHLHYGWYCRDELIRSTRSLVLYFARNYRGLGIAHEDLIQAALSYCMGPLTYHAGSIGVLQGAERFDHTRGYKFSTYIQYWIRKSISRMVARHARGIQVPCTLSRAIVQIQKARKALSKSHGKYPEEDEIAKITGLSLSKIRLANKCFRVVGSIDQKIGDYINAKYLEFIPDASICSPEKTVMRQHMKEDINDLLNGLEKRERQVMVLRYGLTGSPPKSLEEIGRLFRVSKEWIRRIEMKAMAKLRDKETCRNLSHYLDS
ncbi:RNA polymerase sigma factor sigC isoform X1 [Gossypium hirsutum]|uniref:RNA polymerase sigma factor sigC-like isoform X1 n=1 Tax=Gossypium hirsutum TaxID=3635 RepID=A0A1U8III0_GOSHI|nr:RNA polymerase sigma factor sigC isoform X1 [Gossypium hirsutum]XP_016677906.1 RNA polymerase sigma factor sigC isoform X1 [Gossypium hirsutum]